MWDDPSSRSSAARLALGDNLVTGPRGRKRVIVRASPVTGPSPSLPLPVLSPSSAPPICCPSTAPPSPTHLWPPLPRAGFDDLSVYREPFFLSSPVLIPCYPAASTGDDIPLDHLPGPSPLAPHCSRAPPLPPPDSFRVPAPAHPPTHAPTFSLPVLVLPSPAARRSGYRLPVPTAGLLLMIHPSARRSEPLRARVPPRDVA